jgi:N-6 DNA Methylase
MSGGFITVTAVGGLLPPETLDAVAAGEAGLPGLAPADYGLVGRETVREAANRSWTRLREAWLAFRAIVPPGPVSGVQTEVTRNRWLRVLFDELGYGRLPTAPTGGIAVTGPSGTATYPVSHLWERTPIHLLGAGVSLDHRTPGVAGAAGSPPHSLVQELLNRSPDLLWGFVSNGLKLRLLRDSASLVRQAYVEFDLEAMFDGEVFADFALLWLVGHASRVEPRPDSTARADTCWLEAWRADGTARGTRALTSLRTGVHTALTALGRGFLTHPGNRELRAALAGGTLPSREYYRLLLRVVYQLLVLFVAEDRDLLHAPDATPPSRDTYIRYFSTARLRHLARRRLTGGRHADLWTAHRVVLTALGTEGGQPRLGLPGLGGLYEPNQLGHLATADLTNADLLTAVHALSVIRDDSGLPRSVDYRNLGAEELGGVYESLLELVPQFDAATGTFSLDVAAGHDRKTTGSYYTPSGLVEILLDEALDPVLAAAAAAADPEEALLDITICDPACGSGHFLAAAARRIARRLAAVRTGEAEPPVAATQKAMRDVVGRCLYGVDLNPMAAELAKVALWLEALEPGRPFSFLDARIKVGNALIGATPDLVEAGLPDGAFTLLTGDDPGQIAIYRLKNRPEYKRLNKYRQSGGMLAAELPFCESVAAWRSNYRELADAPEDNLAEVHAKENLFYRVETDPDLQRARLAADAWCAAFAWPHRLDPDAVAAAAARPGGAVPIRPVDLRADPPPPTTVDIQRIIETGAAGLDSEQLATVSRLRERYRFFHWPLEFPDVLLNGRFSCVLGNPPWERVKLQDQEFFATRDPEIAEAANAAARAKMIGRLAVDRPALWSEYQAALRDADVASRFAHDSGRYPLTGRGDINTFQIFAEHARSTIATEGRLGLILPTNIATGDTTAPFFRTLVKSATLAAFLDFENEAKIFPGVHHAFRFAVLSATGEQRVEQASFAFSTRHLADLPDRRFTLAPEELLLVNPNSGTTPVFRSRRDAEITIRIHKRLPVLWGDEAGNPWDISFLAMFHMANDSGLFRTEKQLLDEGWEADGNEFTCDGERALPLLEAKMLHFYDDRYGTYDGQTQAQANQGTLPRFTDDQHDDPDRAIQPRYWVSEERIENAFGERWDRNWLLGWRDIARNVDERTMIASAIPRAGVGDKFLLMLPGRVAAPGCLQANLSALVLDYCARQKHSGTSLKYHLVRQFPVLPPDSYAHPSPWNPAVELRDWIADRVLELAYTSWAMAPYGDELHDDGPPFRWDPERRAQLRAELDAAYFHLYGLDRGEVEHVLDSFFVLEKNERKVHGEFRTRRLVLAAYDQMATGAFTSPLTPPPGEGPRHPDRR